jgi:hypothetical protein
MDGWSGLDCGGKKLDGGDRNELLCGTVDENLTIHIVNTFSFPSLVDRERGSPTEQVPLLSSPADRHRDFKRSGIGLSKLVSGHVPSGLDLSSWAGTGTAVLDSTGTACGTWSVLSGCWGGVDDTWRGEEKGRSYL